MVWGSFKKKAEKGPLLSITWSGKKKVGSRGRKKNTSSNEWREAEGKKKIPGIRFGGEREMLSFLSTSVRYS